MQNLKLLLTASLLSAIAAPVASANCCYKAADHSHTAAIVNTAALSAYNELGVIVYRPSSILNVERARKQAALNAAEKRAAETARLASQKAAADKAALNTRLAGIEAKQDTLIAKQNTQNRRGAYGANYGFYPAYGFVRRNRTVGFNKFSNIPDPAPAPVRPAKARSKH